MTRKLWTPQSNKLKYLELLINGQIDKGEGVRRITTYNKMGTYRILPSFGANYLNIIEFTILRILPN